MILRILLSLPLWLAYTAVSLVLDVVGIAILLPMSLLGLTTIRKSRVYKNPRADRKPPYIDVWRGGWLTWLWGNEEDGVTGPYWWVWERHRTWHAWRLRYFWSALRNPSNNLRFVPGINPVIDSDYVHFAAYDGRHVDAWYTWQGVFSGLIVRFYTRWGIFRFWWGWKLKPEDQNGVADADMRKPRCGFALQFKRVS